MIKVCLLRNYDYPDLTRQSSEGTGIWNNIQFFFEPIEECDYLVVFNHPKKDINIKVRKGGSWLFVQEPPYENNKYLLRYFDYFDKVYSGFQVKKRNNINEQALLPWHLDKSYDELVNFNIINQEKSDQVIWITSTVNKHPGHKPRLDFLNFLIENHAPVSLFGRGIKPIDNKWDELKKVKYSIAVENFSGPNYWTEKIVDVILSGCIPFYYGCTNIEDYFPKGLVVPIDIYDHKGALKTITETIANRHWEKNTENLIKAKDLLLNRFQLFPAIERLINQHISENRKIEYRQLKMNSYPMSFLEKLTIKLKK